MAAVDKIRIQELDDGWYLIHPFDRAQFPVPLPADGPWETEEAATIKQQVMGQVIDAVNGVS